MLLAADVTEEHRIDKSEQPAIMAVHRDHWMQVQTVLFAIIAQGRGILDCEDVTPLDQPSGARAGGRDHLFRSHTWVTQEARNTHLAGAIAAHPTHADAGLADTDQTGQQAGPLFPGAGPRTVPNYLPSSAPKCRGAIIDSENGTPRKGPLGDVCIS